MDQERNGTEQQVTALGREWAAAELRGDTAFLSQTLADDFVGVGPRGFMLTKEQWLARYQSGDLQHAAFTWEKVRVRAHGDAAVVTGRQSQQGTFQGREIAGEFRGTQVFVRQDGRWVLVALHLSPIAAGS